MPIGVPLMVASTAMNFIGGQQEKKAQREAGDKYLSQLSELGDDLKSQYEDFKTESFKYRPGGQMYQIAEQSAIDTAFHASKLGEETGMSKGINLSSYGSGVMQDTIKDKYTSKITEDYGQFAKIGVSYDQLAGETLSGYTDLMSSAYQIPYMTQSSETSIMSDLGNLATQGATLAGNLGWNPFGTKVATSKG